MDVKARKSALLQQHQNVKTAIEAAIVQMRQLEGAIAMCDEFIKETSDGKPDLSSGHDEGAGRDPGPDHNPS